MLTIVGYPELAAHVVVTTTFAAVVCCLITTYSGYIARDHLIDPGLVDNDVLVGILVGIVAIPSASATSSLCRACAIGIVIVPIYFFDFKLIEAMKLDVVETLTCLCSSRCPGDRISESKFTVLAARSSQ